MLVTLVVGVEILFPTIGTSPDRAALEAPCTKPCAADIAIPAAVAAAPPKVTPIDADIPIAPVARLFHTVNC